MVLLSQLFPLSSLHSHIEPRRNEAGGGLCGDAYPVLASIRGTHGAAEVGSTNDIRICWRDTQAQRILAPGWPEALRDPDIMNVFGGCILLLPNTCHQDCYMRRTQYRNDYRWWRWH